MGTEAKTSSVKMGPRPRRRDEARQSDARKTHAQRRDEACEEAQIPFLNVPDPRKTSPIREGPGKHQCCGRAENQRPEADLARGAAAGAFERADEDPRGEDAQRDDGREDVARQLGLRGREKRQLRREPRRRRGAPLAIANGGRGRPRRSHPGGAGSRESTHPRLQERSNTRPLSG